MPGGVDVEPEGGGLSRQVECGRFDGADEIEHAPVLQPDLVVEEPPQLLGDLPDGLLRPLGGLGPVVVDRAQPPIGLDLRRAAGPWSSRSDSSS